MTDGDWIGLEYNNNESGGQSLLDGALGNKYYYAIGMAKETVMKEGNGGATITKPIWVVIFLWFYGQFSLFIS